MEKLQRTQILLEPQQHRSLYELAQAEGRSMSELVREAVAQYLVEHDDRQDRWQANLEELTRIREEIQERFGVYPGDLVAELREERADELERRMFGEV